MNVVLLIFVYYMEGIANVRCLITQMTSWCNVKGARIGKIICILLFISLFVSFVFWICLLYFQIYWFRFKVVFALMKNVVFITSC